MKAQEALERYAELCSRALQESPQVKAQLLRWGLTEPFLFETFRLGYAGRALPGLVEHNEPYRQVCERLGLLKGGKERLSGCLTLPILGDNKEVVNIVGYPLRAQVRRTPLAVNAGGIFNQGFLRNTTEWILTEDPLEALLLIQADFPNTTFLFGAEQTVLHAIEKQSIRKVVCAFDGHARLTDALARNGISVQRISLQQEKLVGKGAKSYLEELMSVKAGRQPGDADAIQAIEGGFLFRFPHLSYRLIGTFTETSLTMKANIKAFTAEEVFVDSIDLYKNRDRQNLIYNLMDRFSLRDPVQLEQDLHLILEVIEKHRQKKAEQKKRVKPPLADHQEKIGLAFLTNPHLVEEIEADYTRLGYVRERKNKLLLYLIMTSRLMAQPLHGILISRSGAGKSLLVEVTEQLCPPEDVESISDLSAQALYYYGQDDLKHRFIVIGEKEGSQGAEYPLRELISRRSITKAIPMKDPATGEIKTVTIRVNGPISLAETTTSANVNPENLNRCFVLSIDESEEQTRLIHQLQRRNHTLDGYMERKTVEKIIEKHIYAQRLLKPVLVFNPFAEALTFPSAALKTRRDNEKLLRLIQVICFLHQYQRKLKRKKLSEREVIEYLECTPADYRIAYELLADGVLDNTLDDLPASARKLLELIQRYLAERSSRDGLPVEKIIFERKDIRAYTSWSFAQVRNTFRILRDYEYIQLIKSKNGLANQYRLNGNYSDLDFLTTILKPEELEKKLDERSVRSSQEPEHTRTEPYIQVQIK